jgi:hypothetical protein
MNADKFWQIIAAAGADRREQQLELLRCELERLPLGELLAFTRLFAECQFAAYNWDLWTVAWLSQPWGCSDDSFMDFRCWLISRGRISYEAALEDADSLADELRHTRDPGFESFGSVSWKVWRSKTAENPPDLDVQHPKEPSGGKWMRPELKDRSGSQLLNHCTVFNEMGDSEFDIIQKRFPKTWELSIGRGIIKINPETPSANALPTPEALAAKVDPNLAQTDFPAYLKALADAAQKTYKPKQK